jgi:hypothetical protein
MYYKRFTLDCLVTVLTIKPGFGIHMIKSLLTFLNMFKHLQLTLYITYNQAANSA